MHISKDHSRIDDLIAAYFTQSIETRDLHELQSWLKASEDNKEYFRQQQEVWFASVAANDVYRFNSEQAYRRFLGRTIYRPEVVKPKTTFNIRLLLRVAVAVALLVGLFGGAFWLGENHLHKNFADVSVEAPLGSRTRLNLPDGTQVWLNAGSKLTYSQGFGVSNRKVSLEGEGYFEVTKNKHLPFAVRTYEMQVTVLGTKFNFRNYAEDQEACVTLLEGEVSLNNELGDKEQLFLKPNQRAVLDKKSGIASISAVKAYRASQWTKGILCFNEEILPDIVRKLERSYNVRIAIVDDTLKNYRFYGNFNRMEQSIGEVLEILASTNKLTYQIKGKQVLLYKK